VATPTLAASGSRLVRIDARRGYGAIATRGVVHHRGPHRREMLEMGAGANVMSSGRVVDVLPSTVVRIRTRDGVDGFGETCPLGSTYLPAFAEGARAALRELAPALIGVDAANLAAVTERMDATLRGQGPAKSALDVACWDVLGRATGVSVATLLGG